jgi:arylsulfatase A-like enzyme
MDFHIGRLLAAIKAHGLWDRTVVVVVAGQGEGVGDHDWWSHGILYQEQIRVPMMIRAPGFVGRVSSVVRTIDLVPTVLELAGIAREQWPAVDGQSLVQAMRTGKTRSPRLAYADSVNMLTYGRLDDLSRQDRKLDKLYCLIQGKHKLIYHQLDPKRNELYDLEEDPWEENNLAALKPDLMIEMIEKIEDMGALSDIMPGTTGFDPDRARQLESLGYIE